MARFKALIALAVLAVWFPATAHCLFEGIGVIAMDACCKPAEAAPSPAGHPCDGPCDTLESGKYQLPKTNSKPSTPTFAVLNLLSAPATVESDPPVFAAWRNATLEWVPRWQFVSRAALPPRAP